MRPSGVTPVASMTSMEAPDKASVPRCIRCQSFIEPSIALYWHIGETVMRFSSSSDPIENGVKSLLVIRYSACSVLSKVTDQAPPRIIERQQYRETHQHQRHTEPQHAPELQS